MGIIVSNIDEKNNISIIKIDNKLNLEVAPELQEVILRLFEKGQINFYIDFADVRYIDSSGLGILVMAIRMVSPLDGKVVLIKVNSQIKQIFDLAHLTQFFEFTEAFNYD